MALVRRGCKRVCHRLCLCLTVRLALLGLLSVLPVVKCLVVSEAAMVQNASGIRRDHIALTWDRERRVRVVRPCRQEHGRAGDRAAYAQESVWLHPVHSTN